MHKPAVRQSEKSTKLRQEVIRRMRARGYIFDPDKGTVIKVDRLYCPKCGEHGHTPCPETVFTVDDLKKWFYGERLTARPDGGSLES